MTDAPTAEPVTLVELEPRPSQPLATTPSGALAPKSATPAELLRMAMERGANLDMLERLMALQERHEANEARKAFTEGMTLFKAEPMEIFKRKQVEFVTRDGDTTRYKHAELSDVAEVVVPALARHGFSHRWDVRQEGGRIFVTCVVTHRMGHSESLTMDAAPDDSGKKNNIQRVASAVTYLQRYTLLGITGLATKGEDDDGAGAGEHGAGGQAGREEDPNEERLQLLLEDLREKLTDEDARLFYVENVGRLTDSIKHKSRFKAAVVAHRGALAKRTGVPA